MALVDGARVSNYPLAAPLPSTHYECYHHFGCPSVEPPNESCMTLPTVKRVCTTWTVERPGLLI